MILFSPQRHNRNVIKLISTEDVFIDPGFDFINQTFRCPGGVLHYFNKPFFCEGGSRRIAGICDPVGVYQQHVIRLQGYGSDLKIQVRVQPDGRAGGAEVGFNPFGTLYDRRLMAAVDVSEFVPLRIENPVEDRCKHTGLLVGDRNIIAILPASSVLSFSSRALSSEAWKISL